MSRSKFLHAFHDTYFHHITIPNMSPCITYTTRKIEHNCRCSQIQPRNTSTTLQPPFLRGSSTFNTSQDVNQQTAGFIWMSAQIELFVKVKWDMLKLIAMMDRKKVWRQYDCFKELLYYFLVESTKNCKVINYDAIKTINMIDYYRFR